MINPPSSPINQINRIPSNFDIEANYPQGRLSDNSTPTALKSFWSTKIFRVVIFSIFCFSVFSVGSTAFFMGLIDSNQFLGSICSNLLFLLAPSPLLEAMKSKKK